jgi:SAM-dependent methyltransferase
VLVDVSERPLKLCRERFKNDARIQYILSSGSDLPGVEDGSIDAVWSFDVFVHVSPRDQAAYLKEIALVLAPGGTAVVHHSDERKGGQLPCRQGWRARMSRGLFAVLAAERELKVECQLDSWCPAGRYDLSGYGMPSPYANVKCCWAEAVWSPLGRACPTRWKRGSRMLMPWPLDGLPGFVGAGIPATRR